MGEVFSGTRRRALHGARCASPPGSCPSRCRGWAAATAPRCSRSSACSGGPRAAPGESTAERGTRARRLVSRMPPGLRRRAGRGRGRRERPAAAAQLCAKGCNASACASGFAPGLRAQRARGRTVGASPSSHASHVSQSSHMPTPGAGAASAASTRGAAGALLTALSSADAPPSRGFFGRGGLRRSASACTWRSVHVRFRAAPVRKAARMPLGQLFLAAWRGGGAPRALQRRRHAQQQQRGRRRRPHSAGRAAGSGKKGRLASERVPLQTRLPSASCVLHADMGCAGSRAAPRAAGSPPPPPPLANDARNLRVKLVLLGDSGVGKSCIVMRFVRGSFDPDSRVTVGAACASPPHASSLRRVAVSRSRRPAASSGAGGGARGRLNSQV